MKINQFLSDTGGNTINSLSVGSAQTITTSGVDTNRAGNAGLFLIFTGTIVSVTREVSYDNTNFYTPYDRTASLGNITTTANNSRYVSLSFIDSANIVSPFERFNVKTLSGGTLSVIFTANEQAEG